MTAPPALDTRSVANIVPSVARSLLGLVDDRGLSAERMCRGLGFTYQDLCDQHLLLSHLQLRELILRCQRALQEPALGLAVGARQTPVSWGVAGLAMLTCETLGDAMTYAMAHQAAAGAMMDHLVEAHGHEIHLEVMPRQFDLQIDAFLVDEALSSVLAVARCLVGTGFKPLRVDLAQPRPDREELHRRHYRCPVRFDTGCNRMTFEAHWLGARLPGYDRITCGLVRAQLNTLLSRPVGRHDLVESVANRMRFAIDAKPTQIELARMVNVSDRTLRRRLGQQSTTYREMRDQTRYARALDLLSNSDMTVAQVAELVGYSDARAFRRAFKRWAGVLPNEFRAAGG
ncbi:MAG: AraC family transcriptional regulator [Burkholderiales bacterium]|nr:MAG: AraC family transcriptional regulator [Burkholderiales bacterium]